MASFNPSSLFDLSAVEFLKNFCGYQRGIDFSRDTPSNRSDIKCFVFGLDPSSFPSFRERIREVDFIPAHLKEKLTEIRKREEINFLIKDLLTRFESPSKKHLHDALGEMLPEMFAKVNQEFSPGIWWWASIAIYQNKNQLLPIIVTVATPPAITMTFSREINATTGLVETVRME